MVAIQPTIPVNNPMQFTATFADSDGRAFDPASGIVFTIMDPLGTVTRYTYPQTVQKLSTGVYYVTITLNVAGEWVANGRGLLADGSPITTPDVVQRVEASYA